MEKSNKLLSVIIPVYKAGDFIYKSTESILNSTYSNIELILVDDGSPDDSGERCEEIARKDSRVRVVHKTNGGISSARNAGIKAAAGDYIAFVDQDDSVRKDMYETLMNKAAEGFDIVVSDFLLVYPDREEIYHTFNIHPDHDDTYREMLLKGYGCNIWNMVMSRQVVVDNGVSFPDHLKHCEDWYFSIRLHVATDKIAKIDEPFYIYNLSNPDQVSNHLDIAFVLNGMKCVDQCIDFLQEKGLFERYKKEFIWNILQTKTNFVYLPEYYDLCRNWHPVSFSDIINCSFITKKMRLMLLLNKFRMDSLSKLIVKLYM